MEHLKVNSKRQFGHSIDSPHANSQEDVGKFLLVRRLDGQNLIGLARRFIKRIALDRSEIDFEVRIAKYLTILFPHWRLFGKRIRSGRLIHHQVRRFDRDSGNQGRQDLAAGRNPR